MPQVIGQMPAMVAAPPPPPPTYPAPHDFFILALVTTMHHLWHPHLDIPGIWLTSDHSCSNGNNDY